MYDHCVRIFFSVTHMTRPSKNTSLDLASFFFFRFTDLRFLPAKMCSVCPSPFNPCSEIDKCSILDKLHCWDTVEVSDLIRCGTCPEKFKKMRNAIYDHDIRANGFHTLFRIHRIIQSHFTAHGATGVSFQREKEWPYWSEQVGDKLPLMLSSSAGFVKQGIKSDQMQLSIRRAPVIVSFLSSACFIAPRLWKARVCKLLH